jgi:hypothetical protein
MSQKDWTADDPFQTVRFSAVHLEMRDTYGVAGEAEGYDLWKRTGTRDPQLDAAARAGWMTTVRDMIARGVVVRRAGIVSEPATEYIKYEHSGTEANLNAGELVRWLPRRQTADIALPGTDLWMFDEEAVEFTFFSGDGVVVEREWSTKPAVVELVRSASRRCGPGRSARGLQDPLTAPPWPHPHRGVRRPPGSGWPRSSATCDWRPACPGWRWPPTAAGTPRRRPGSSTARRPRPTRTSGPGARRVDRTATQST